MKRRNSSREFFLQVGCASSTNISASPRPQEQSDVAQSDRRRGSRSLAAPEKSSAGSIRRLSAELKEMNGKSDPFSIQVNEDTLSHWTAIIRGPADTPYAGAAFLVDIMFPPEYPFAPPKLTFRTPIFHPNIALNGAVCLDILKPGAWSPLITVPSLLVSVQSLLADPNADDPLNLEAADLLKRNPKSFHRRAQEEVKKVLSRQSMPSDDAGKDSSYTHLQLTKNGAVLSEEEGVRIAVRNSRRLKN